MHRFSISSARFHEFFKIFLAKIRADDVRWLYLYFPVLCVFCIFGFL